MSRKREAGIPVVISMASLASYDGITNDPMELVTTGMLFPQDRSAMLKYTENTEDEMTGEMTEAEIQLELRKDLVTMNRSGEFSNTMLFQRDRRYETTFHTPYGDLPMAVYARDVKCDMGKDSGTVHLRYELSMQGTYASTNELHLEYRAKS